MFIAEARKHGSGLLSAVTRLLILADMVDVHRLLKSLRVVEDDLERLRGASSQAELEEGIFRYKIFLVLEKF